MIVVYSFVGKLPKYSIDTVYQLRLFYDGIVIFIISDYLSPYVSILQDKYQVTIVKYNEVECEEFDNVVNKVGNKIIKVPGLTGREDLFLCSFERFFLLKNLMLKYNLENIFFMELDNLVYDNPENWETIFSKKELAIMYDAPERCSSGISYFKNYTNLKKLTDYFLKFIETSTKFISEMGALWDFYQANSDIVQILPTHWGGKTINKLAYENFKEFNDTIFDAAAMGIYLGGVDPFHTGGQLKKFTKWLHSEIDYTIYKFDWRIDNQGRNIPYIKTDDNNWLKINNLHVHSKQLEECLSKSL
jgi:hypothetical protein